MGMKQESLKNWRLSLDGWKKTSSNLGKDSEEIWSNGKSMCIYNPKKDTQKFLRISKVELVNLGSGT